MQKTLRNCPLIDLRLDDGLPLEQVWGLRHEVMWPGRPFDFIKKPGDKSAVHLGLLREEQLLAVVSLFVRSKERLQFCKFAVKPNYQGLGLGSCLLREILCQFALRSQSELYCEARASSSNFYQRFGMKPCSQAYHRDGLVFQNYHLLKG